MSLRKKSKTRTLAIWDLVSILAFFLTMILFIVNACTAQNLAIAWTLFAFILLFILIFIVLLIVIIVINKENIKNYFKELR